VLNSKTEPVNIEQSNGQVVVAV